MKKRNSTNPDIRHRMCGAADSFALLPKKMINYNKSLVVDEDIPVFKILKNEDSEIYVQFGMRRMLLKIM